MENEQNVPFAERLRRGLRIHWHMVILILWPIVSGFVFLGGTKTDLRCAYVVVLMAGYWVTEALPLGITSLIPIFLFPLLSILDSKTVCQQYINNTTIMFMCSLFIAFAIEESNIHRRIALKTILCIGTTHLRLTFGFMMVTMFISMWIVNTAATAMMAPIVIAVLGALEESQLVTVNRPQESETEEKPYPSRTTICYFSGIAYASSIGGIGSLIGTGTNLTYRGIFEKRFPEGTKIEFANWLACMAPMMLAMNILTWAGLAWQYLGLFRNSGMDEEVKMLKLGDKEQAKRSQEIARDVVKQRYAELGSFTWAESWVLILFILFVILLITATPDWMRGWGTIATPLELKDSVTGVFIVLLLFSIPISTRIFYCLSSDPEKRPNAVVKGIITWDIVKVKMMWGLVFLLGSGSALAKGSKDSGMSAMIGQGLKSMKALDPWLVLFIVCFVASIITEFTSNVAVCNILVPVLLEMAVAIEVHPIYLTLPAAVCCSFSFMLPVGTPPNALIAGYANVRTKDMIITGILPTVFTLLVVVVLFPTYGAVIYTGLKSFPTWATTKPAKA